MAGRILVVATNHTKLSDGRETGSWVEEIATPYYIWKQHGYEVILASIKGGKVPFDPSSTSGDFLTKEAAAFLNDPTTMDLVASTKSIAEILSAPEDLKSFDALFIPGGHGIVFDGPPSKELQDLIAMFWSNNKVVSAVCHGPAALVEAKTSDGKPLVQGRRVSGFTDSEERGVGKDEAVPFLLESKLKELGCSFERADDWHPFAVRDGNLITGQNPMSSGKVAEFVAEAISPHLQPSHEEGNHAGHRSHAHARAEHHEHRDGVPHGVRADEPTHPQAGRSSWHHPPRQ